MGSCSPYLKVRNEEINASEAGLDLFSGVILARFLKFYDLTGMNFWVKFKTNTTLWDIKSWDKVQ